MNIAKITIHKSAECPSMVYLDGIQKTNFGKKKCRSQYCEFTKRYVNRDAIPDWCPFKIDMMENK